MKQKYVCLVFGVATLIFTHLMTFAAPQVDKKIPSFKQHSDRTLVATTSYLEDSNLYQLNIYRKNTGLYPHTSKKQADQRRRYFKQHPEFESGNQPNTLTNRIGDKVYFFSNDNKILGLVYGLDLNIPLTLWSSDTVWHSSQKKPYYVLSRSYMDSITLAIFSPDPNSESNEIPSDINAIHFDKVKFHTWPKPTEPLSELKTIILSRNICGISHIKIMPEPNYLLISLHKEHADCDPVYVRFDLDTMEWFWVKMENEKIESEAWLKPKTKPEQSETDNTSN